MSWHAQVRSRRNDSGLFRSHTRMGVAKAASLVYRNWTYEFTTHQTGLSVSRKRYSVTISDPRKRRAEYLRDFVSQEQATVAVKEWIDTTIEQRSQRTNTGAVGAIPSVPTVTLSQAGPSPTDLLQADAQLS